MVQILKNPYSDIGRNLGTGLNNLAQFKINQLQQQQQRQRNAQGLQALIAQQNKQISPQQAEAIAQLHPDLIKEYVKGVFNPKQALVNNNIGQTEGKIPQEIKDKYNDLIDLNKTAKRALKILKSNQTDYGFFANAKSNIDPSLLDEQTELFDKETNHILNLGVKQGKGNRTKYGIQTYEKEKPGVKHSPYVNEQILNNYIKESDYRIKNLMNDFPQFAQEFAPDDFEMAQESDQNQQQPKYAQDGQPPAQGLPDNAVWEDDNGQPLQVVINGQWVDIEG